MKLQVEATIRKGNALRPGCPDIPTDEFDEIAAELGEYIAGAEELKNLRLEIRYLVGGPDEERVLSVLRKHSIEPRWRKFPNINLLPNSGRLLQMSGNRIFEPEDFEAANVFEFHPKQKNGDIDFFAVQRDGCLCIRAPKTARVGFVSFCQSIVCRSDVARMLCLEFPEVELRPILKAGERVQDLHELWSSKILPPAKNLWVTDDGSPWDGSRTASLYVDEVYAPPLIEYSADEIKEVEPFDFGITLEHHAKPSGSWRDGAPIVSRRFRDWCCANRIKAEFLPVRLSRG